MARSFGAGSVGWAYVLPALLFTVAFFVAPLLVMAFVSLTLHGQPSAGLSADNYTQFFTNPAYWRAMVNSLEVSAVVTVVSVLLAYPFAWIIAEHVPGKWQRLALVLAVLPFWTSYIVRSYAWLLVLAENGVVNQTLLASGFMAAPLQLANTRFATITGFVHFFVMLLTLTIYTSLRQLPKNYARAAADLGASPLRIFWHIILPLTLPGVAVGAFLTFVLTMGDFITPQILGGNNELLMPQLIMLQLGRRGDFASASALSLLLMAVVSLAYVACARWLTQERV